jgi:hypothetical protein
VVGVEPREDAAEVVVLAPVEVELEARFWAKLATGGCFSCGENYQEAAGRRKRKKRIIAGGSTRLGRRMLGRTLQKENSPAENGKSAAINRENERNGFVDRWDARNRRKGAKEGRGGARNPRKGSEERTKCI